jgi:HEAT repeat protein
MRWLTLQQLKSKNPATRLQVVEKLASAEDPGDAEPLMSVLGDEHVEVRKAAAKALGRMRMSEAVEPLINALRDPHPDMRQTAATALKMIGDKTAVLPLVSLLKDQTAAVRYHAMSALDGLSWVPRNDTERALRSVAQGQIRQAADFGVFAIEALVGELQSGVHYKRIEAVETLAKIRDSRVIKPLTTALKDDDSTVRAKAVEALGNLGDHRAADSLALALKDKESRVRAAAVGALAKVTDARSLRVLIELLSDSSAEVRHAATEAISKINDPAVVEVLLKTVTDKDADIRQVVVNSLGRLQDQRAITPLVIALTDRDENVRQAAESALGKLNKNWQKSEEAMRAVPTLQVAAEDKEQWIRQLAAAVLKRIVGELPRQEEIVREETVLPVVETYRTRRAVHETLASMLVDADRDLRVAAIAGLMETEGGTSTPKLVTALRDNDHWVRSAAARSLEVLGWTPTNEEDRLQWLFALEKWTELAAAGPAAVFPLLAGAQEKSTELRCKIAETLGQINDPAVIEPLMLLLNDASKKVRKATAHVLVRMGPNRLNEAQQLVLGYELTN